MNLHGQQGYAMAALLVALSIMAVVMTAAMPVWTQAARRDREAELIFRGQQYARAIGLFQRKAGPGTLPPNVDVLISQRFLRKKFLDPITGEQFDFLTQTQAAPGARQSQATPSTGARAAATQGTVIGTTPSAGAPGNAGGLMGVASKSKAESIRIYNGRTHYNEWQFVFVPQVQAPTAPGNPAGPGNPSQRGGPNSIPTTTPGFGVGTGRDAGRNRGPEGQGPAGNAPFGGDRRTPIGPAPAPPRPAPRD